jgi:hypothetical protein
MQSTDARDKRADTRRDCRLRVTIQEEGSADNRLQALACDDSRSGVRIEVDRPLWPGMIFRIMPEDAAAAIEWADAMATVRWCTVRRPPDRRAIYVAGLQFRLPEPAPRPVRRFQVIAGRPCPEASSEQPARAIRAAARPSEGRAAVVPAARMACPCNPGTDRTGNVRAMPEA